MASHLNDQEIDRAVERIRAEYDHYIVHYQKTAATKRKFEERYTEALRHRMDLTLFLGAEIQVVQALLAKAKAEAGQPPNKPPQGRGKVSYADQIVAKLRARIQGYPALGLPDHPEKSPDVDRLYGTLRWFRKELWAALYPLLLAQGPDPVYYGLDVELEALTAEGDRWPKEVETYWALVTSNVDLSQVARAQNRCLLLGAQFLQRVKRTLMHVDQTARLSPRDRTVVTKGMAFCDRVLSDFRLKELAART